MKASREQIMADILGLLRKLADDWEYTGEITPQTRFFTDMGLGSLDVVVLGTAVQEHSPGVPLRDPFAQVASARCRTCRWAVGGLHPSASRRRGGLPGGAVQDGGVSRRTILLGLDGATFSVLGPLMRDGVMPFLRDFVASGVSGDLRSVIPALTPPAWTSLTTGRTPGHHGIFDFFCKESPDSHNIRVATARDIHAETIWSLADRSGLRTIALNFPLMFPPPRVRGVVVPGWMPWRQMRLGCHPQDVYDRLKALPGFNAQELAMDITPEAKPVQGVKPEEHEEWVAVHTRRERQWASILRYLMEDEAADLTAIVYDGVDRIQHLCWRFISPAPDDTLSPHGQRVRERCLEYFRVLDGILAEAVKLAGPEATVVLASDHGFGPQTGTFFVNAWLEQRGYLAWAGAQAPRANDAEALGIEQLARHVYLLDWDKTRAFAPTPSRTDPLPRRGPGHPNGVTRVSGVPGEAGRRAARLHRPATGQKIVSSVWTRDEVFEGPYKPLAPDLTLDLADGGLVSILAFDSAYMSRSETAGTHRRNGIFIAHGPGIQRGRHLEGLSILDVAPILLQSLGLDVPAEMEGRCPRTFDPSWLSSRPSARAASPAERPPAAAEEVSFTKEDEAKLAQRLRDLGYIE
jgi:predicted AlkP superfamily phosphohydrolase/phosphomutase